MVDIHSYLAEVEILERLQLCSALRRLEQHKEFKSTLTGLCGEILH